MSETIPRREKLTGKQSLFQSNSMITFCSPFVSNGTTCDITQPLRFAAPIVHDPSDSVASGLCVSSKPIIRPDSSISRGSLKIADVHPYRRNSAAFPEENQRKMWKHAFEKSIFSNYELWTVPIASRRKAYILSLEAYIEVLHERMERLGFWAVPYDDLEQFSGLDAVTIKGMVAALRHDISGLNLKLNELEHHTNYLRGSLAQFYVDG